MSQTKRPKSSNATSDKLPRYNHYVPKFILSNFARNGKICVFDKHSLKEFKLPPYRAMGEKDFTNVKIDDVTVSFESKFTYLENVAAPIIRKILEQKSLSALGPMEVAALHTFVVVQFNRSKRRRLDHDILTDEIKKRWPDAPVNPWEDRITDSELTKFATLDFAFSNLEEMTGYFMRSRALSSIRLSELKAWADAGQRSALINYIFDEMRTVFNGGKKANSILLASQWYFNGSHGSDELLEYVQLMVVLEIILGDKAASDQMGLNELLRNRCAYLIGNSHEDRASVLDLFRRIYEVRSQIVHRGKHRLSGDERILISQLRWLCLRVIQKEVDLLKEDKKSEPALPASCLPMWRSSAISALSTAGGLSWIIRYDVSLTFSSQLAAS